MHSVQYTMCNGQCAILNAQWRMQIENAQCTICNAPSKIRNAHYKIHDAHYKTLKTQYTMYNAQCNLQIVQFTIQNKTIHNAQCTINNAQCTILFIQFSQYVTTILIFHILYTRNSAALRGSSSKLLQRTAAFGPKGDFADRPNG